MITGERLDELVYEIEKGDIVVYYVDNIGEIAANNIVSALIELKELKYGIMAILDAVDYTQGNCKPNDPIGGVLPVCLIENIRELTRMS